jgi:hypothetical protein
MTTDTPPALSDTQSPDSSSSPSPPASPLRDLGAVAVSLATVAAVVVLRKWRLLDDVPGWGILVAVAIAGLGASERARILGTAARGLVGRGRSKE